MVTVDSQRSLTTAVASTPRNPTRLTVLYRSTSDV
jgi:hypothetical protein